MRLAGGTPAARLIDRMPQGVTLILIATAIAGGCGYIVNAIVGATMPVGEYTDFGVFWSALYLVVAALSGIQQEITRATNVRVGGPSTRASLTRNFAIFAAILTAIVILGSSPLWANIVFPHGDILFVLAVMVGGASYVVVAALSGTFYGLQLWPAIAMMTSIDGVLRLLAVGIVLGFGGGIDVLVWAVVIPFPLTPFVLWWFVRQKVVGQFQIDVGYAGLSWNVMRTIVASVATGVLISGYPLVLRTLSPQESSATLGALIFSINLVRAPLVIIVMSLQSYLVVRFRAHRETSLRVFWKLAGLIVAIATLFSLVAWFIVPIVLKAFWPEYVLDGIVVAGLVAASGLLGVLCVSGPLALARSQHGAFVAGWVAAAVCSVGLLLVPGDVATRMFISLSVGPILGTAVHLGGVYFGERQLRTGPKKDL